MSIRVEVHGIEQLRAKFAQAGPKVQTAVEVALVEQASRTMEEAQKSVPVLTGELRTSVTPEKKKVATYRSDIRIGYRAIYAAIVHESQGSRGYQWFARAAKRAMAGFKQRLAQALRVALRK